MYMILTKGHLHHLIGQKCVPFQLQRANSLQSGRACYCRISVLSLPFNLASKVKCVTMGTTINNKE